MFLRNIFAFLRACFIAGRRAKKKKQSRNRRVIPPRLNLGIVAVRLVFWNAEIRARTSVLSPSTLRSRRARPARWWMVVRVFLNRAFQTGWVLPP